MEDATKEYNTNSDDESCYCCNVESSNSSDDESFYCCNVEFSNSSDDESFSSLDVDVDVSSCSNLAVSFAEFDFSERMYSSHLECSSGEKIATDETPSRPLENISNVEGVFSERKKVSKSSDGEFCSEEKTAGNETSTSSIEFISDEEQSSETNVVKLASEEKTFSETPRFSMDIGFDVAGVFSEKNNVSKLSSDDEFCSEQKTAGNETLSSSTEVISGEEPSSGENVVKLPSAENTVSETSKISTEIASNVEETPSESSSVESPDRVQKGRESFEHLDFKIEITEDLISSLMKRFKENQYIPSSAYGEDCDISSTCIYLFKKSYKCETIRNDVGELCYNYPGTILLPMKEKKAKEEEYHVNETSCSSKLDPKEYLKRVEKCRYSRVRRRFAVPVILIDGKLVCRSATLSNPLSSVSENIKQQPDPKAEVIHEDNYSMAVEMVKNAATQVVQVASNIAESTSTLLFPETLEEMHCHDRELLQYLGIDFIFDLMVEKEKVCFVKVSSSEKVKIEFYEGFIITQIPYPGCEFFEEYHRNGRNPEGLKFDWEDPSVTEECKVPASFIKYLRETDYSQYKDWDLVKITQEYLFLQLVVITSGSHNALVHCISGWDRTALFTCLLRLSLWADHWIHDELTPLQMAYLTVGYDWYLFGHNLPVRLRKKEEIMHFCFKFLGYIASDNFSMTKHWSELPEDLKLDRKFPVFIAGDRRKRLEEVQEIVLRLYDVNIMTTNVPVSTDAPRI